MQTHAVYVLVYIGVVQCCTVSVQSLIHYVFCTNGLIAMMHADGQQVSMQVVSL